MEEGIDIASLAVDVAAIGFQMAGTGKTTATLHLKNVYAPSNDFVTDSETPVGGSDVEVEGIKYQSLQQQRADLTGNTSTFMIQGSEAPDGIEESDWLTIDGIKWNVETVENVANGAVFILKIKR